MKTNIESDKVNEMVRKLLEMNSRNKFIQRNVSKSTFISNDYDKKNFIKQNEDNFKKTVKLGDEFGDLFSNTRLIKLERRLLTPTTDEKNFEIKRMVFSQKRELKPELTYEYLQNLYKLLNLKDKNFIKKRKILSEDLKKNKNKISSKYRISYLDFNPLLNDRKLSIPNELRSSPVRNPIFLPSKNKKTNKNKSISHDRCKQNEEISKVYFEDSNKFVNEYIKKFDMKNEQIKSENVNLNNNINQYSKPKLQKGESKIKLFNKDNMSGFFSFNDLMDPDEDKFDDDQNEIINESNGSHISRLNDDKQNKLFSSLAHKIEILNIKTRNNIKESKVFQFGKKVHKDTIDLPLVKNIKELYNGVKLLKNNRIFEKQLHTIYSQKSSDNKKKIILKDDLFTRVKKIDETRSLKLKDLFQKKVEI